MQVQEYSPRSTSSKPFRQSRRHKFPLTPEIEAILRKGRTPPAQSYMELAVLIGVSDSVIRHWIHELGLNRVRAPQPTEWPADQIARLRALWAEGLSTAEIGRRIGVSKSAVVGKAHRLNLPARPSPIIRDGRERTPRPSRAKPPAEAKPCPAPRLTLAIVAPTPAPLPVPAYRGKSEPCCWIVSGAGRHAIRCDAPSLRGRSYCPEHQARSRQTREVADAA